MGRDGRQRQILERNGVAGPEGGPSSSRRGAQPDGVAVALDEVHLVEPGDRPLALLRRAVPLAEGAHAGLGAGAHRRAGGGSPATNGVDTTGGPGGVRVAMRTRTSGRRGENRAKGLLTNKVIIPNPRPELLSEMV